MLPEWEQIDATLDSIYDLASLTKLFTSVVTLRLIDQGKLDYKHTVASYMPEFGVNGKENITILNLVTHTSGFAPDPNPPLYYPAYKTYESRVQAILKQGLMNPVGRRFVYSDLNFMSLMLLAEKVSGCRFDELVYDFTVPLGMWDTFFNRGNIEGYAFPPYPRMVAEEYQIEVMGPLEPKRPQPVRGTVHDENAWALDGVSGHAGLFSTARDVAKFAQMILNNGTYGGVRVLSEHAVDLIFHNFAPDFPQDAGFYGDAKGFGFMLNTYFICGPMASVQVRNFTHI